MAITQRIISEIYDNEDDNVLKRIIIKEKVVVDPKKIDDVAYNQAEQISILQGVQDEYLSRMASMMGEASCSKCGGTTARTGQVSSDFHSIYTDHKVKLSRRKCKVCGLEHNKTIHSLFGSNMHPDLVKRQAEVGSETSYMKAQIELEKESGKCRSINNRYTIKKTVDRVGEVLDILHKQEINSQNITAAKHLIVQTDGGFVKDKNPKMRSFEVLISKVYNIEEHDVGYIDKNGIRRSGNINNKIYAASALKDRNLSIKKMTMTAALRQGMTSFTKVTAISDGAKNCWDVLKSLKEHCKEIEYVLDWYHIKQRFENILNKIEDPKSQELKSIQWKIWHGNSKEALQRLSNLYINSLEFEYADKVHELLKYLKINQDYLVNYNVRKDKKLPYTSSIIESAVENIINDRHKKKQKAQWTRYGAHNVLQIRTSTASGMWKKEWDEAKYQLYNYPVAA